MKLDISVKARIFCKGYFTPGIHSSPKWIAEVRFSQWCHMDMPNKTVMVLPDDQSLCYIQTEESYDTAEEAVQALKNSVGDIDETEVTVQFFKKDE